MTRLLVVLLGMLTVLPSPQGATKREPAVNGTWLGAPSSLPLCKTVDLLLRLNASADAADVTAEILASAGVDIVSGTYRWAGAMRAGQVIDLPVRIRFVTNGDLTLGARVTNRRPEPDGTEVSGPVLNAIAAADTATLSTDSHAAMRLAAAVTPEDFARLGLGREGGVPPAPDRSKQAPGAVTPEPVLRSPCPPVAPKPE